jgi:hypothetical protein
MGVVYFFMKNFFGRISAEFGRTRKKEKKRKKGEEKKKRRKKREENYYFITYLVSEYLRNLKIRRIAIHHILRFLYFIYLFEDYKIRNS